MQQLPPDAHCKHENQALVRRLFTNGIEHFGSQCLDCGKWDSLKKNSFSFHQLQAAIQYDPEIARRFSERQRGLWTQQTKAKSEAWWSNYHEYITSDEWRAKAQKVLKRDNYICRACLERRATQAHHLTYKHFGWEPLFDLIAVCRTCHEYLHKKEREREYVGSN